MKNIVLLADGTGNSAKTLFRTNVWRLYQALDLEPSTVGRVQQIAFYHDGVGTSSFKPLAILGGVFGVGLKRNLLDLYKFLCRTYESGDRIYAFGFSRGAFTIRILIGLVATKGLWQCPSETELDRAAARVYRDFRRDRPSDPKFTKLFRWFRDLVWTRQRLPGPGCAHTHPKHLDINFVGVWDTVAAYGLPLDELTRGVDRYIYPLSMRDYKLSPLVKRARHALSLDDERNTFHPLLWDEINEQVLIDKECVKPDRLRQIWFAGVHSNVGGGYPVDGLANVTLAWMMDEAGPCLTAAGASGLRFKVGAAAQVAAMIDGSAPLHDSRRGLSGYYRYQPRKIEAFVEPPAPRTRLMQNPDLNGCGLLQSVNIHQSVFDRIKSGIDRYGPTVIPADYNVVGANCAVLRTEAQNETNSAARADRQEQIWNKVWRKRILFFLTLLVSAALAAMPLPFMSTTEACLGRTCLATPFITATEFLLPAFAQIWTQAFAAQPGLFLGLVVLLAFLLWRSSALQRRIHDEMHALWKASLAPAQPIPGGLPQGWIYRLRSNCGYQRFWQKLKWTCIPWVFARGLQTAAILGVVATGLVWHNRYLIAEEEKSGALCTDAAIKGYETDHPASKPGLFLTRYPCWPIAEGAAFAKGKYRVVVTVVEPWFDASTETSPVGFPSLSLIHRTFFVLRRAMNDRWFQPLLRGVGDDGAVTIEALDMQRSDESDSRHKGAPSYSAEIDVKKPARFYFYVNDALIARPGGCELIRGFLHDVLPDSLNRRLDLRCEFYSNNHGAAEVTLETVPPQ
jgi:uncharacterized protein (DUF2235 family)